MNALLNIPRRSLSSLSSSSSDDEPPPPPFQLRVHLDRAFDCSLEIDPYVISAASQAGERGGGGGGIEQKSLGEEDIQDTENEGSTRICSVDAFHLPNPTAAPVQVGGWTGSIAAGASVNCSSISMCPHGAGTHTEGIGHIRRDGPSIGHIFRSKTTLSATSASPPVVFNAFKFLYPALLVSVKSVAFEACPDTYPAGEDGDLVISSDVLQQAVREALAASKCQSELLQRGALVVRTGCQDQGVSKDGHKKFSGTNPPYFTAEAAAWMASTLGVFHLVVDMPSVDKEHDGGHLVAHKAILERRVAEAEDSDWMPCSVTEMARMSAQEDALKQMPDGLYMLDLQVAPIEMDAAPSRPVLYPASVVSE